MKKSFSSMAYNIKRIIFCWDFIGALLIVILFSFITPLWISQDAAKEIFTVSISVLSIVFAVFFAAVTILITAGDNDFVRFLMEDGTYKRIIWPFRISLLLLFIALLASIFLFILSIKYDGGSTVKYFPKWVMLFYTFVSLYALFASVNAANDAVRYAEFRAKYLDITKGKGDS